LLLEGFAFKSGAGSFYFYRLRILAFAKMIGEYPLGDASASPFLHAFSACSADGYEFAFRCSGQIALAAVYPLSERTRPADVFWFLAGLADVAV
jgi:hypothetical protein